VNEELPALTSEAGAIAADAERVFGPLSREQLNWKRQADQWSVAQCFEHLIKINTAYFPQFRGIEEGRRALMERSRALAGPVLRIDDPARRSARIPAKVQGGETRRAVDQRDR
jgi:hypothetical protein